jgi:hypothetical protein
MVSQYEKNRSTAVEVGLLERWGGQRQELVKVHSTKAHGYREDGKTMDTPLFVTIDQSWRNSTDVRASAVKQ